MRALGKPMRCERRGRRAIRFSGEVFRANRLSVLHNGPTFNGGAGTEPRWNYQGSFRRGGPPSVGG
jgi:hypothetical protein